MVASEASTMLKFKSICAGESGAYLAVLEDGTLVRLLPEPSDGDSTDRFKVVAVQTIDHVTKRFVTKP